MCSEEHLAISNARAHAASIKVWHRLHQVLVGEVAPEPGEHGVILQTEGEVECVEFDGEQFTDVDSLDDCSRDCAIDVLVRTGWRSLESADNAPDQFCIVLSTGGPGLRLVGGLDARAQPVSAEMQWRDWDTLWTPYTAVDLDDEALQAFVSLFYFGG